MNICRCFMSVALLVILPIVCASSARGDDELGDGEIVALLERVRDQHRVPGIAGAIVTTEGVVKIGVAGVRKAGTTVAVTVNDEWHIGSNTKAMTATLVAKLVEQGKLKWDTTLAEVFPRLSAGFHADMKRVTVLQLLAHRSGLPANLDLNSYRGDSVRRERLRAVKQYLALPPQHKPGAKYQYSNLGYIIVGAMIERITDESWEENMVAQIFRPLSMRHVGFGGVGTPGETDQPWGHSANGQPVAGNGPKVDNPPVMGPAGRVHCTLQDWGRFVADQLRGAQGERALLRKATYKTLHTPPFGGDYALGWVVVKRDWGGGNVLHHTGSNTMNYANAWVAPGRGFAVLVCINQGGTTAAKATDAAAGALIRLHQRDMNSR